MAVTTETRGGAPAPPRHVRSPAGPYLASLPVDRRLAREDVAGSIAHVEMLGEVGILAAGEAKALANGLRQVWREVASGGFPWREDLEDVHTNVEVRLTEILGPLGGKVHTARSRNDQVVLDERLWLRSAVHDVLAGTLALQEAILGLAAAHATAPMPGTTHLRRAQPVTLGHALLVHVWRLSRDFDRLDDAARRADVCPLGAGALAGSTLPIDPARVARRLGFGAAFENSIDAVGDRDHLAEYLAALALLAVHLGSLGEELVLWASDEVGFLRPSPALGSGSSLMPQKRNPDVAELARGKAGRAIGDLVALLTTLKSLPPSYQRDLQEDKGPVFDATDHVLATLHALASAVPTLEFDLAQMEAAASDPGLFATDLAERLVARGTPFREAHEAVAAAFAAGPVDDAALRARFGADAEGLLDPRAALERRASPGGPGPAAVDAQLARARDRLALERYAVSKHADHVAILDGILREESE